jgi:hypothetical protein
VHQLDKRLYNIKMHGTTVKILYELFLPPTGCSPLRSVCGTDVSSPCFLPTKSTAPFLLNYHCYPVGETRNPRGRGIKTAILLYKSNYQSPINIKQNTTAYPTCLNMSLQLIRILLRPNELGYVKEVTPQKEIVNFSLENYSKVLDFKLSPCSVC